MDEHDFVHFDTSHLIAIPATFSAPSRSTNRSASVALASPSGSAAENFKPSTASRDTSGTAPAKSKPSNESARTPAPNTIISLPAVGPQARDAEAVERPDVFSTELVKGDPGIAAVHDNGLIHERNGVARQPRSRRDVFQYGRQPLRLGVRQSARVRVAARPLHLLMLITCDGAVPPLELDDVKPRSGEHQHINLIEAASAVGESHVRPCTSDAVIPRRFGSLRSLNDREATRHPSSHIFTGISRSA